MNKPFKKQKEENNNNNNKKPAQQQPEEEVQPAQKPKAQPTPKQTQPEKQSKPEKQKEAPKAKAKEAEIEPQLVQDEASTKKLEKSVKRKETGVVAVIDHKKAPKRKQVKQIVQDLLATENTGEDLPSW